MRLFYLMLFASFLLCALAYEKAYWRRIGDLQEKSDSIKVLQKANAECRRVFIKAQTECNCPILNLYDTIK